MKTYIRAPLALAVVSILAAGCGEGVEMDRFEDSMAVTSRTDNGIEATLYSPDQQQVLAEMSLKDGDTTVTVNANGTLLSIPVGDGRLDEANAGEVLHAYWATQGLRSGDTTYLCGIITWYIIISSCDALVGALETQCQHEAARDFGC